MQQNNTITIKGVSGKALPLVHDSASPMPRTKEGVEYEVPRTAYYVRAWKRGDIESPTLDAEHGKETKTTKTKTADKGEK